MSNPELIRLFKVWTSLLTSCLSYIWRDWLSSSINLPPSHKYLFYNIGVRNSCYHIKCYIYCNFVLLHLPNFPVLHVPSKISSCTAPDDDETVRGSMYMTRDTACNQKLNLAKILKQQNHRCVMVLLGVWQFSDFRVGRTCLSRWSAVLAQCCPSDAHIQLSGKCGVLRGDLKHWYRT